VKPWGPIEGICSGPEQCREAVRYQMKWGADLIKIAASGGVLSEADPVDVPQLTLRKCRPSSPRRTSGAARSRRTATGTPPRASHRGRRGLDRARELLTEDTLRLMKAKGVYLVPTRMAVYW